VVIAVAALAVGVIAVATHHRPVAVTVAAVRSIPERGGLTILNASGYVEPRRRATVAAKITGRVTEVLVDEGMWVEHGQILARLDDSDARRRRDATRAERDVARAALDELQVNLADAVRTLRRTEQLHDDGVASDQDLDTARAAVDALEARLAVARVNLEAAEAQLAVAEQDLENYIIRAPFAGVAVSKDAQPGEMVSPVSAGGGFTRTGISTIVDMTSLEIEVDVNESYIARVHPGQPADAVLDAYPDWHIPATVRTVIPTADRQKATVKVRLTFDELDPRILPDMGIKVAFQDVSSESDSSPSAHGLIPQDAVRADGDRSVAFVVDGDSVERRAIALGRQMAGEVEVVAGLSAGERVVVTSAKPLSDGQRVRLVE
jgi:RND family efflux transporter MFP subunit